MESPINQKANDMDTRWPLPCVDMVYVLQDGENWVVRDFYGEEIYSGNRSYCFFKVTENGLLFSLRH